MNWKFIRQAVRANSLFYWVYLLFLVGGAILLFLIEKGDAIFYFSDRRSEIGDAAFRFITKLGEEYVYFVALIGLLLYKYRYAITLPAIGISVSIFSYFLKQFFAHDRPSLYFRKLDLLESIQLVDGVRLNGGANSFPSGHTMSAFAFYTFMVLVLPKKKWIACMGIALAILVGVSRVYLVQHFFEDIYLGSIIGLALGMFWYALIENYPKQPHNWMDNSLLSKKQV